VSPLEVTLTQEQQFVTVQVAAPAQGVLRWSAASEDTTLCTTSPGPGTARVGAGELVLGVPLGFRFWEVGPARTYVHVVDVGGLVADQQVITVNVGVPPAQPDPGTADEAEAADDAAPAGDLPVASEDVGGADPGKDPGVDPGSPADPGTGTDLGAGSDLIPGNDLAPGSDLVAGTDTAPGTDTVPGIDIAEDTGVPSSDPGLAADPGSPAGGRSSGGCSAGAASAVPLSVLILLPGCLLAFRRRDDGRDRATNGHAS
jgi:hypothetical protein